MMNENQKKPEQQPESMEITVAAPSALEAMERADIDIQITTAKVYPRSITKFLQRAKDLATVDAETAAACFYRRPVGKEGGKMVFAEGESIRFAEIVAASYGNLRYGAIISDMQPKYVKAIGFAHDLEGNLAVKAEVVESTVTKDGMPYSERMRVVVAKAAQSKAIRDAIFRVVPKSVFRSVINAVQEVALGEGMTLEKRRANVLQWIETLKIDQARVWMALGVTGLKDVGNEQLLILVGAKTAIKDGEATIDEMFPPLDKTGNGNSASGVAGVKGKLKKPKATKQEPPVPENENKDKFFRCGKCKHTFAVPKLASGNKSQCPNCFSLDVIDTEK